MDFSNFYFICFLSLFIYLYIYLFNYVFIYSCFFSFFLSIFICLFIWLNLSSNIVPHLPKAKRFYNSTGRIVNIVTEIRPKLQYTCIYTAGFVFGFAGDVQKLFFSSLVACLCFCCLLSIMPPHKVRCQRKPSPIHWPLFSVVMPLCGFHLY